ncbi:MULTISPECIES: acyl carrier protein [unclassified Moorena]|uniref:acyl carrier protein n=1 Tax=unclassified Moorena TaxID=2683338 RepID=UPI0013C88108|nr:MULTISPECIES: acyl carrier protein [unclassified Moorena]NEO18222.1 acyl carrier protein [Moorena sp. SIO4A5]NEP21089.1 acyl carrier protein [Moorena sp. SIO3I6]NEQ57306.1 acyl carrier protein [Moorena sp. SIO4A1]
MLETIPDKIDQECHTEEAIQAWLVSQLAEGLEVDPEEIDIQEPFESYNLESADALILLSRLENYLGREVSPTLLWNYPNIEALAERLAEDPNS